MVDLIDVSEAGPNPKEAEHITRSAPTLHTDGGGAGTPSADACARVLMEENVFLISV